MVKNFSLVFALAVFSVTAQSLSTTPKLSGELAGKDPQALVNVIVQWKRVPGDVNHLKVLSRGGLLRRRYKALASGAYTVPASALRDLANDPDVEFIAPDRQVRAKLDYTAAAVNAATAWSSNLTGSGIGIALIDSGVNANADLKSRVVYSQDFTTGVTTQVSSSGNTVTLTSTSTSNSGSNASGSNAFVTSISSSGNTSVILAALAGSMAPDFFGHGEHVAGILAGSGATSSCGSCNRTLKGIAPGANIINLKVLDANGIGTDSEVIAAIDEAISMASTYNIRVINLSLGRPVYESYTVDPLCQAVEQAWKAGIVVVVAAGNDGRDNTFGTSGYGTISAPGNDPYVITVGAMKTEGTASRSDDLIASYSSKGPSLVDGVVKPDLVAPGNLVVSLLASPSATLAIQNPGNIMPRSYYQNSGSSKPANTFFQLSGTSMATPVVSGAAALLLQANPNMTPDQVKARLMLTAYKGFPNSSVATDPVTGMNYLSYYDIFTVGAGYLDIAAALADKSLAQGTAMSPRAVADPSGVVGLVANPSAVWNLSTVWGVQSVFDVRTVWGVNTIDASRTVWGLSTVWGVNTIWGVNTVWGVNSVAGNSTVWGVGIKLNGPSSESMASGIPLLPNVVTAAQSTSLSIAANGEN